MTMASSISFESDLVLRGKMPTCGAFESVAVVHVVQKRAHLESDSPGRGVVISREHEIGRAHV